MTNALRGFWEAVAAGGDPNTDDIRREGIPTKYADEIRRQVRQVHALKANGEMGASRKLAAEFADYWLDRLGDELEPPSSDPLRGEMDPRKLAEGISRW